MNNEDPLIHSLLHEHTRVDGEHDEVFLSDLESRIDEEDGALAPTNHTSSHLLRNLTLAASVIALLSFSIYQFKQSKESSSEALALQDKPTALSQLPASPSGTDRALESHDNADLKDNDAKLSSDVQPRSTPFALRSAPLSAQPLQELPKKELHVALTTQQLIIAQLGSIKTTIRSKFEDADDLNQLHAIALLEKQQTPKIAALGTNQRKLDSRSGAKLKKVERRAEEEAFLNKLSDPLFLKRIESIKTIEEANQLINQINQSLSEVK